MIYKYSSSRTLRDNIVLGSMTSFTAGAVNVASYLIFFSFSSNVTGYYAILSAELIKGNFYQIAVVMWWIFLFFIGGFISNLLVITNINRGRTYLAHFLPLALEILCIAGAGFYGQTMYRETLFETEVLLSVLLLAMGLQNGFTASISNFAVKTTHLTGATTDMGVLFALFTQKQFRQNQELVSRATMLVIITLCYLAGGIFSAYFQITHGFKSFFLTCAMLMVVIVYDFSRIRALKKGFDLHPAPSKLFQPRELQTRDTSRI